MKRVDTITSARRIYHLPGGSVKTMVRTLLGERFRQYHGYNVQSGKTTWRPMNGGCCLSGLLTRGRQAPPALVRIPFDRRGTRVYARMTRILARR